MSFLLPSPPQPAAVPAPPPAANPSTMANTSIAQVAASQKSKAVAAAGAAGNLNPDLLTANTAKPALLGAT